MSISYFIGLAIGGVLYTLIHGILATRRYERNERWLNKLSPDKKTERWFSGHILYANGATWYLENFVEWKLIMLSNGELNGEIDVQSLYDQRLHLVEFQATFLPKKKKYRIVKKIIFTHPHLKTKGFWKVVVFIDEIMDFINMYV